MDEEHTKVKLWLEEVLFDDFIPQYEINNKTMAILKQLVERNRTANANSMLVMEDMKLKAIEYDVQGQKLSRVLNHVGLPPSSLSQSGLHSIKILSDIALLLGLKDCTATSLLLGIINQSQTLDKLLDDRAEELAIYSRLISKTRSALVQVDTLQRTLESLEEQHVQQKPVLEKRCQETGFLQSKAKEYQRIVKELEGYQKSVSLDPGLYHETLVKKAEDINYLKEKTKPLKQKLDSYQDLPPDLSLAKVKVEEAKIELARLEQQLSSNIDMLHI